jgi:hypothetical protein
MTRTFRWVRRAVWAAFAVIATIGCNPLATIAFLTHKDTPVPAKYPLIPKEGPKKEKKEISVALFVSQGTGQSFEFAGAESTVASEMARKIPELAKENKQKVKVIPPSTVNQFKFRNPTWKNMHASEWGKSLGVDYVLEIHLDKMRLYKPGSINEIYEGRAEVTVYMYDVEAGVEEPKYYTYPFSFPRTGIRPADAVPVGTFRKDFLERLALELAEQHMDHKPSSGIAELR